MTSRFLASVACLGFLACTSEAEPVRGRVLDRRDDRPIAGARVVGGGHVAVTDGDGRFALRVPAGEPLLASAPGFLALRRAAAPSVELRVFPATTTDDEDRRLSPRYAPAARALAPGDVRAQAQVIEARLAAGAVVSVADVSPSARAIVPVPESIRVWRRRVDGSTDSCTGRVDVIPFDAYVKGVLPHEWIPSWDPKALEMGAVAIRTYASAWVAAGGKYDCADLDDTAASQVYEDETLPKTDAAVDATAGVVVVKDGSLVFAEYSAENSDPTKLGALEPHCTGRALQGHGRGTCQWGTQRWATSEAKDFVWMTAHYYPGAEAQAIEPPTPDPVDADLRPPPPETPDAGLIISGEIEIEGGCACRTSPRDGAWRAWPLALAALVVVALRRRRHCRK